MATVLLNAAQPIRTVAVRAPRHTGRISTGGLLLILNCILLLSETKVITRVLNLFCCWPCSLEGFLSFIHSFFHSCYFYSAFSSPLLLRGAPDTAWVLCRSFTPKRHRQQRVKDLPKFLHGG